MFNKKALLILSVCFLSLNSYAQTLPEVLATAYKTNPELKASRNSLQVVDENVAIANSGYRPSIAFEAGYDYQDVDSENLNIENSGDNNNFGVVARQSLFAGMSTYNSVKSAKFGVEAAQNNFYNTEQSVLLTAATSYLNVLRAEATVKLQENNESLLKQRLDETLKRFEVGEVTRTDVSQAKARHAEAKADTINAKGELESIKAEYQKIVGDMPSGLQEPTFINALTPASLEEAIKFAKENNFSLLQAKNSYMSEAYNVAQTAGALLPSVDLVASAIRNNSDTEVELYGGDLETDTLSVGVSLSMPIYDAGLDRAKLRQSKYQKAAAADGIITATRDAIANTTSTYEVMNAAKAQLEALDAQIAANQLALDGVQKEEALGNRTLLNVLDAYQELLNSEVNKEIAKENYYVSALQLLVAMGKLTAAELKLDVEVYNPEDNYNKTKGKWLSTSVNEGK